MKKLVLCLTLACLLTLCLAATARALSAPTVGAIIPGSGPNDGDTAVVITGTGFAVDGTTPPTVTLGTTSLTAVTFVNDTTLSATVPVGITPGLYTLTVTNPDTGSASLPGAFTVTAAPTVSAIEPASAYNDIDTAVTITGADFATGAGGTVVPTVTLGGIPLTGVAFVSDTTLTATVPWGMDTGPYDLTVTNPDGGTGSISSAFTVDQGIGKWNSGDLFGGEVRQILMKPGDPDTLYAPTYRIHGLFRSTDAGEHWVYAGADLPLGNGTLAIDPLNPGRLYACTYKGLQRSQDDGDTWTTIMPNTWPGGRDPAATEVFPSPYHTGVLFITAHDDWGFPASGNALGLIKSTNAGASWKIVADLEGVSVVNLAFDPADHQQLALVTSDARVLRSTDGGDEWSEVAKPPLSAVGVRGKIAYNPYTVGEVWIASSTPAGIYKSADAGASWNDVTETNGMGGWDLTFTGPLSVYTTRNHTTDGGTSWDWFGPIYASGAITFDPNDPQIAYLGDNDYGVQKTTDGGATWAVKNQGLSGLSCASMDASAADPLRVYASMGALPGVHRSLDGANGWSFFSLPIVNGVFAVREDPTDPQRVYAVSHEDGFCRSTDGGETWDNLGWNASPPVPSGLGWVMEPDPFQSGHLLVGWGTGMYLTGPAYLYASTDAGESWQQVAMPQTIDMINDIAFDPSTSGLVYLTTNGTGVYRSTDGGGSWARIDDPDKQPGLQSTGYEGAIAIATHPRHLVTVAGSNGYVYRSADEGATWQRADSAEYPGMDMFVDGDSTRLYKGTGVGLFFSKDVGDTWTRAAGAFGRLQIMAVDYAIMDGHAIIYAATNGGQAGTSGTSDPAASRRTESTEGELVTPGLYRYVVVTPEVTLKLSGLRAGTMRLGHRITVKGVVTPTSLSGSKVTLTVQRRYDGRWMRVKAVTRTIGAAGAYSWTYQPGMSGAYRVRATMTKTATHTAAVSTWRGFRVR